MSARATPTSIRPVAAAPAAGGSSAPTSASSGTRSFGRSTRRIVYDRRARRAGSALARHVRAEAGGPDVQLVEQPVLRDGTGAGALEQALRLAPGQRRARTVRGCTADGVRERRDHAGALGAGPGVPLRA